MRPEFKMAARPAGPGIVAESPIINMSLFRSVTGRRILHLFQELSKVFYFIVFIPVRDRQPSQICYLVESRVFGRSDLVHKAVIFQLRKSYVNVRSTLINLFSDIHSYVSIFFECFEYQKVRGSLEFQGFFLVTHVRHLSPSYFLQLVVVTKACMLRLLPTVTISSCNQNQSGRTDAALLGSSYFAEKGRRRVTSTGVASVQSNVVPT